jgi:hypothetical protein
MDIITVFAFVVWQSKKKTEFFHSLFLAVVYNAKHEEKNVNARVVDGEESKSQCRLENLKSTVNSTSDFAVRHQAPLNLSFLTYGLSITRSSQIC